MIFLISQKQWSEKMKKAMMWMKSYKICWTTTEKKYWTQLELFLLQGRQLQKLLKMTDHQHEEIERVLMIRQVSIGEGLEKV
jgi:hypothetical protein